jgi:hypothetical protein
VARTGDAVGDDARQLHRSVIAQAEHDGPGRLRHGRRIDHGQHRDAECARQVGRRRCSVIQAHDAFDQNHVGHVRGGAQLLAAGFFAHHPHVEGADRRAAGHFQQHRVEEVRAAFEDAHLLAALHQRACEGGGDGGLALAGRHGGHQHDARVRHVKTPSRPAPRCRP